MNKQEEIREGIADILEVWMTRDLALVTAHTIMAKESYQGVVIKVDRELPNEGRGSLEDWGYEYVAVVPLVKDG